MFMICIYIYKIISLIYRIYKMSIYIQICYIYIMYCFVTSFSSLFNRFMQSIQSNRMLTKGVGQHRTSLCRKPREQPARVAYDKTSWRASRALCGVKESESGSQNIYIYILQYTCNVVFVCKCRIFYILHILYIFIFYIFCVI